MFARLIEDVKAAEQTTDVLEHKINLYLTSLSHGNLSRHAVAQAFSLFDVLNSIERMGDCGEKSPASWKNSTPNSRSPTPTWPIWKLSPS